MWYHIISNQIFPETSEQSINIICTIHSDFWDMTSLMSSASAALLYAQLLIAPHHWYLITWDLWISKHLAQLVSASSVISLNKILQDGSYHGWTVSESKSKLTCLPLRNWVADITFYDLHWTCEHCTGGIIASKGIFS